MKKIENQINNFNNINNLNELDEQSIAFFNKIEEILW